MQQIVARVKQVKFFSKNVLSVSEIKFERDSMLY